MLYCLLDLFLIAVSNSLELMFCNVTEFSLKWDVKAEIALCSVDLSAQHLAYSSSEPREQFTENEVTEAKDSKATIHVGDSPI